MFSREEKKISSKPKKTFLAADLRNMHDILSKNMYKIRQRVRQRDELCSRWSTFSTFILYDFIRFTVLARI